MRKLLIFAIIASLLLCLAACGKGYGDTVAFDATVTQVGASRITVTTHDEAVSFTEANVSFAEGTKISFTPAVGQHVRLHILPLTGDEEVPNVTAVRIAYLGKNETT